MVQKVDSLNTISNRKPLSVISRSENGGNFEVFSTDSIGTNVDEVKFSNKKNEAIPEEKNDKKEKWLIAAGIAVGSIAACAISYGLLKKQSAKIIENIKIMSPARDPKLLEAISPKNYTRLSVLKDLSPDEIKILYKSSYNDASCFFPTLTGHKPACILGDGQDLSFLTKIKDNAAWGDKLDIVHLAKTNTTYILNKEKVLEVIQRNKDFYICRLGLPKESPLEDIYSYMLQHKDKVFNCCCEGNYQDIVGITLGFPRMSSILFQLEHLTGSNSMFLLREDPAQYRKVLLSVLNNNKELYENLSPNEYNEIVQAIRNYVPIKTKTLANKYYQYVKLANEPEEFARIEQSIADFINTFSVKKLF